MSRMREDGEAVIRWCCLVCRAETNSPVIIRGKAGGWIRLDGLRLVPDDRLSLEVRRLDSHCYRLRACRRVFARA